MSKLFYHNKEHEKADVSFKSLYIKFMYWNEEKGPSLGNI